MADFWLLPPEINSARMYSGPGSAPLMAAAAGWDALAGQLEAFAAGYSAVLAELHGQGWSGSASVAMAGAAAPYVTWAAATAGQAGQAANRARAAAAAYETAFAATVPPAVVAANRVQLATLVATNFFGQNTALIAATEAAYAEMWAQDSAAMFGYAASAAASADMAPFPQPPRTTDTAGHSAQAAAVLHAAAGSTATHTQAGLAQLLSAASQQLHTLSATGSSGSSGTSASASSALLTLCSDFTSLSGPANFISSTSRTAAMMGDFVTEVNLYGLQAGNVAAPPPVPVATTGAVTAPGHRAILAHIGRAGSVGQLSVPRNWATSAAAAGPADKPPVPRPAFRALPPWASGQPASMSGAESTAGLGPPARLAAHPVGHPARRMRVRRFRMPQHAVGG